MDARMVKKVLCVVVVCSFVFVSYVYGSIDTLRPQISFVKDKAKTKSFPVLSLNCGSSSVKAMLYDAISEEPLLAEPINISIAKKEQDSEMIKEYIKAIDKILNSLPMQPIAVGHRVVHGGNKFGASRLINVEVLRGIKECNDLAPLHNKFNLLGIKTCLEHEDLKDLPMAAVFDTAFHQTMPERAFRYALPEELYEKYNIRRYGFHGSSHRYVSERATQMLKRLKKNIKKKIFKIITIHLGSGCSIAAIRGGKSVDTSMGLTPLEGLVMSTRTGDLGGGIMPYLERVTEMSAQGIETLFNKKSGLLGLSGISDDMKELIEAEEKGDKKAKLAIEIFIYRILKYVYGYTGILNGADAIVLTGGIGETDNKVSQRIKSRLRYYFQRNGNEDSRPSIFTIKTNEELIITRDMYAIYKILQSEQNDKLFKFISNSNREALISL